MAMHMWLQAADPWVRRLAHRGSVRSAAEVTVGATCCGCCAPLSARRRTWRRQQNTCRKPSSRCLGAPAVKSTSNPLEFRHRYVSDAFNHCEDPEMKPRFKGMRDCVICQDENAVFGITCLMPILRKHVEIV